MSGSNLLRSFAVACGLVLCGTGLADANPPGKAIVAPDEAMQRLMEGNRHYVDNRLTNAAMSNAAVRASLAASQNPYAIILSCSESRVPPEIIFDKGLGEIFVVRVAGNIPDPVVLGSIEYAAEHLGSTLIMVLGHERCGAVTAAVEAKGESTGSKNIDAIVNQIAPSVDRAARDCPATTRDGLVGCVIATNARQVAAHLTEHSEILRHLAEANKIRIVVANYDLDDGKVTVVK